MKPVSGKGDCVSWVSYSSVLGAVAVNLANQHILVECWECGGGGDAGNNSNHPILPSHLK